MQLIYRGVYHDGHHAGIETPSFTLGLPRIYRGVCYLPISPLMPLSDQRSIILLCYRGVSYMKTNIMQLQVA